MINHSNVTCDKMYGGKENLNMHLKQMHENDKPFKCEMCLKSFAQKIQLKKHVETYH